MDTITTISCHVEKKEDVAGTKESTMQQAFKRLTYKEQNCACEQTVDIFTQLEIDEQLASKPSLIYNTVCDRNIFIFLL